MDKEIGLRRLRGLGRGQRLCMLYPELGCLGWWWCDAEYPPCHLEETATSHHIKLRSSVPTIEMVVNAIMSPN